MKSYILDGYVHHCYSRVGFIGGKLVVTVSIRQ